MKQLCSGPKVLSPNIREGGNYELEFNSLGDEGVFLQEDVLNHKNHTYHEDTKMRMTQGMYFDLKKPTTHTIVNTIMSTWHTGSTIVVIAFVGIVADYCFGLLLTFLLMLKSFKVRDYWRIVFVFLPNTSNVLLMKSILARVTKLEGNVQEHQNVFNGIE